jgi:hypothetical protein
MSTESSPINRFKVLAEHYAVHITMIKKKLNMYGVRRQPA